MIPVNVPQLMGNEKKYVMECLETGWISSEGPFVEKFESAVANYLGKKFGIAVSSGTAALDLAVLALGIGPGDEVIVPTLTIISCVSAITRAGGIPVLVDCHPETFNMDAEQVKNKITSRTKAIMVVHLYGLPCDMDPLLALAKKHQLKIIEDCAEMLGQEYKGIRCGHFGDITTLSFYANKIVTSGEGGMILTDDHKIAEQCSSLRNLCFQKERRFVHEELGWNYRITNLQAALGLAQFEQIEKAVEKKRWIGEKYQSDLLSMKQIKLPIIQTDYAMNIYWVFSIVLDEKLGLDAKVLADILSKKGVATRPFFWPMHEQPVFKKMGLFKNEKYPHAEYLARYGLYLPSGLGITEDEIHTVTQELRTIFHD